MEFMELVPHAIAWASSLMVTVAVLRVQFGYLERRIDDAIARLERRDADQEHRLDRLDDRARLLENKIAVVQDRLDRSIIE